MVGYQLKAFNSSWQDHPSNDFYSRIKTFLYNLQIKIWTRKPNLSFDNLRPKCSKIKENEIFSHFSFSNHQGWSFESNRKNASNIDQNLFTKFRNRFFWENQWKRSIDLLCWNNLLPRSKNSNFWKSIESPVVLINQIQNILNFQKKFVDHRICEISLKLNNINDISWSLSQWWKKTIDTQQDVTQIKNLETEAVIERSVKASRLRKNCKSFKDLLRYD
jgi:hypothetical protein